MGRRSPIRSEASGMIIRSANDVIVSELEKNVVSKLPPRSIDDTSIRNREYPNYSSHMSHEEGQANHNHPKLAHSNFSTSRSSQPFTSLASSVASSSMPGRGGAPSMARMSQGRIN